MKKRKLINIVVIFVAIVALVFGGFFYYKLHRLEDNTNVNAKSEKVILKEKNNLISKIGELYVLPGGEMPTVATVSDPKALKDQGFLVESMIGDKFFFFTKAKKAVLYRPSLGKIIDIVSINNASNASPVISASSTDSASSPSQATASPVGSAPSASQPSATTDTKNIKKNAN